MTTTVPLSPIEEIVRCQDREEAFYRLVSLYLQGPEAVREEIREKWDFGVEWTYPNPKRLACSTNERYSCMDKVLALLVYVAIVDLRQGDKRDELMTLAVVYHGCRVTGIDPKGLFEKVAVVSSTKTARFLLDFINRSSEDKSLEAFMLVVQKNADGESEITISFA